MPADGTLRVEHYVRSAQIAERGLLVLRRKLMLQRRSVALFLVILLCASPLVAQTPAADSDLLARIRQEETSNSQIMKTMHMLADVYGPRLTGTPNASAVFTTAACSQYMPTGFV